MLLRLIAGLVAAPAFAQAAPPLTELLVTEVRSATQAERIAPGQAETGRRHNGPITLVVREKGIGRMRVVRIGDAIASPQASQRPLCGPALSPGACRPGATTAGVEVTYHLGPLKPDSIVTVQDTSANLPAQTLSTTIVIH